MKGIHYLNGDWLEAENLKISAFDLAVTRGLAVFDTLRTYNGQPFLLERHLARFRQAVQALAIKLEINDADIEQIIKDGLSKNRLPEAVIRLSATAGVNEGRLSSTKPSFIVMFLPLSLPSPEIYARGQSLKSVYIPRTLPQIKTINYVSAKLGLGEADKTGADEAIYLDANQNVLETTISNIFFWQGDGLVTPPPGDILLGITRGVVMELAQREGIEVTERNITLSEVGGFEEAFACSSIKEILAVSKIDDVQISKQAGPKTKSLAESFKKLTRQTVRAKAQ